MKTALNDLPKCRILKGEYKNYLALIKVSLETKKNKWIHWVVLPNGHPIGFYSDKKIKLIGGKTNE